MCAGDQTNVVYLVKFLGHFRAEEPAGTTRGHSPRLDLLRVGPHEVTEGALVRDLHFAVDESNLIERLNLGRKSAMDAEDFSFDNGADRQVIEDLHAELPGVGVSVLAGGLFVEAVESGGLTGLVVASKQGDVAGVLDLEAEQELDGLDRVIATINVITHEDVR